MFILLIIYQIEMSLEPFVKAVLCLFDVLHATSCAGDTVYKVVTVAVSFYACRMSLASCMGGYSALGIEVMAISTIFSVTSLGFFQIPYSC